MDARYGKESPSPQAGSLNPRFAGSRACVDGAALLEYLFWTSLEGHHRDAIRRPRHRRNGVAQDRKRQEPRAEFNWRSAMALNLSQKQEVVAELADVAAKAHSLVAAEYAGTTVSQMTAMRKKARETGVYLKVVKNTLASRAVAGTEYECRQGRARRSAAVCVLDGGTRRCRSSDQGIRQGQRQAAGEGRVVGGKLYPGQPCRRSGFAADPRSGAGHAGPRPGRAGQHVRPRRQGRGRPAGWRRSRCRSAAEAEPA